MTDDVTSSITPASRGGVSLVKTELTLFFLSSTSSSFVFLFFVVMCPLGVISAHT